MRKAIARGVYWTAALVMSAAVIGLFLVYQARPADTPAASDMIAAPQSITVNTRLAVGGEKIFPVGFYHVSWAGTREQKYAALEAIGAAGFNFMHPALKLSDEEFVRRAEELGVWLIIEPNEPDGTEALIEAFKDEDIILGWLVADDFNGAYRDETMPQRIRDEVALVNRIAPDDLTYMSGMTTNLEAYMDMADAIGIQTYSIPSDPLDLTHQMLSYTLGYTAPSGVSLIANLQTWADEGRRDPTPEELRNITYQALINGVDGILYYTYLDPIWNLEEHPVMWEELTRLAPEIQALTPALLNGTLRMLPAPVEGVRVGQWSYREQRYVVVINTTEDEIEDFRLPLPEMSQVTPMFADRPSALALDDGALVGTLAPTMVYVYIVE